MDKETLQTQLLSSILEKMDDSNDVQYAIQNVASQTGSIGGQLQESNQLLRQLTQDTLDLNTVITTLAGLIGVLIGAFISYFFNKRISDQTSKARFAIQRKNLIFSKLYKELLQFKSCLEALPEDAKYVEINTEAFTTQGWGRDTFYFDKKQLSTPRLLAWHEMKKDIRATQVPLFLRKHLESLEVSVKQYHDAQRVFDQESHAVERAENSKMLELYLDDHHGARFNIGLSLTYYKDASVDRIVDENVKNFSLNKEVAEEMRKIVEKIIVLDSRKQVINKFDSLSMELGLTLDALRDLIQSIVNKYEYGDSIQ